MENNKEVVEPKETVKLDVFQHLRQGLGNKDNNCSCENDLDKLYYCIPCKSSCCDKCSLWAKIPLINLLMRKANYI